jgi:hypothetical protein
VDHIHQNKDIQSEEGLAEIDGKEKLLVVWYY